MVLCGGIGEEQEADDKARAIANELRGPVKVGCQLSDEECETYEVLSYSTQVVAGTNYFLKLRVGKEDSPFVVHVRAFESLPHTGGTVELTSVRKSAGQIWKGVESDQLVHF
mmetsp:Transcript_6309/g.14535  ORF Transcript_6309/g.14535 Transcript_6309/m.14535 type:complete len:112 (-) Transcript_6309:223-558(-)